MLKELSWRNKFVYEDPSLARLLSEVLWLVSKLGLGYRLFTVLRWKIRSPLVPVWQQTRRGFPSGLWAIWSTKYDLEAIEYQPWPGRSKQIRQLASDRWASSQWRILVDHISGLRSMVRRAKSPENSSARHWIAVTLQCEAGYNPSKILHSLKLTAKTPENGWLEIYLLFFWEGSFSGTMLVVGSVNNLLYLKWFFVMLDVLFSDIWHLSKGGGHRYKSGVGNLYSRAYTKCQIGVHQNPASLQTA